MTDLDAARFAADYHGGQWTALYALSSTGTIIYPAIIDEVKEIIFKIDLPQRERDRIDSFLDYIHDHRETQKEPVPHWSDLHW